MAVPIVMAPERIIKIEGYIANLPWCQRVWPFLLVAVVLFIAFVNGSVMLIRFNYERLPFRWV